MINPLDFLSPAGVSNKRLDKVIRLVTLGFDPTDKRVTIVYPKFRTRKRKPKKGWQK